MEENGSKVHLTTKKGYRKTERVPGEIRDTIRIAEGGGQNTFKITRKAVYTDLETGTETTEYWAMEQ